MLASLLAVLAGVAALAAWSPAGFAIALVAGVALTLAGGAVVAVEARRRALGVADPPGIRPPDARIEAAAGVFVAAFVALVAGAAPGAYFKDGGELAAAAHSLGVAHPTGFPLFCLAGKGFSLLPAGGVFFRLNALSAAATALAAAFAYLLARLLSPRSRWSGAAALLAPAGLLGGHAVRLHGTTTEVYAISLAGLAASLLAFAVAARRRDATALALGWLLTGLGAGGHVTWPIYASMTGIVVTALTLGAWKGRRASILGASALLAVAAALSVLYLPAAAGRDPVVNWGDPSSAAAMLDHLTGRRIRESFAGEIGQFRWGLFRAHLVEVFRVAWQGTGPLWPLAAAGMLAAVVRERAFAACAAGIVAADWLYSARINPMGVHDLQTLQPATLCVSVLAATAIARLMSMGKGSGTLAGGLAAAAALAVGMQWGGSPGERGLAHVHAPREVAAALLGAVEPGATVFTTSDDLSAGVAAAQAVEGARPDVLSVVKQHLSDGAYVARKVRAHRA
ncbi:MAG: DUF2723 domain-containing protein, partial [Deltaproteobacteria bacterium]|nr:DUF2723 domain-containing protein [Deltaproteobacteria bacterium]